MFKSYLLTFLVSMVPLVELRGAIPFAMAGVNPPLPLVHAYIISILGNMAPVPFIYLFARKVLHWGKDKALIGGPFRYLLSRGERVGKKWTQKNGGSLYLALLLFVSIPLPGTGAWTGTLAASLLDLDFKKSTRAVMGGVLLAGVIVGALSAAGIQILK